MHAASISLHLHTMLFRSFHNRHYQNQSQHPMGKILRIGVQILIRSSILLIPSSEHDTTTIASGQRIFESTNGTNPRILGSEPKSCPLATGRSTRPVFPLRRKTFDEQELRACSVVRSIRVLCPDSKTDYSMRHHIRLSRQSPYLDASHLSLS